MRLGCCQLQLKSLPRISASLVAIFLLSGKTDAQPSILLSAKHVEKVNSATSGIKRLKLYRKLYSRDSVMRLRKLERIQGKNWDSLARATRKAARLEKDVGMIPVELPGPDFELARTLATLDADSGVQLLRAQRLQKPELRKYLKDNYGLSDLEIGALAKGDTAVRSKFKNQLEKQLNSNSLGLSHGQRKQIELLRASYGKYSTEAMQYVAFLKDSIYGFDSLKSVAATTAMQSSPGFKGSVAGLVDFEELKAGQSELTEYKKTIEGYNNQLKEFNNNPDAIKKRGIAEMVEQKQRLSGFQSKIADLKGEYSTLLNSNDLSTGIKAKSLTGTPLRERWVVGGNFNIPSTIPFMLDLSLQFGYRIDKRFQVGISGIYRATFVDTVNWSNAISPERYGYSAFSSYGLMGNFFGYSEWENTVSYVKSAADNGNNAWVSSLLVGVGRTFNIHPKVKGSILILGNVLHENGKSPYHSPLVVKTGFQLTQLALMKK